MKRPDPVILELSKGFRGIASNIVAAMPEFGPMLQQAGVDIRPVDYVAYNLLISLGLFSLPFVLLTGGLLSVGFEPEKEAILLLLCFALGVIQFLYSLNLPKLMILRRTRLIEKDLLFALRHLLIKIRSGITLFDAMKGIANGNYGVVSEEFHQMVSQIEAGKSEIETLESAAFRNPSLFFRRALWQIASSMRAGSDIGNTLESIVSNLAQEQKILIRKYGAELNPIALMYMLITVILPTLGVSLLIILSSLVRGVAISETLFVGVYAVVTIFQYLIMGIIKTRRPAIEI